MSSCSIWFSAPSFWMNGGLESRCVGRVCGADVAVRRKLGLENRGICLRFLTWTRWVSLLLSILLPNGYRRLFSPG